MPAEINGFDSASISMAACASYVTSLRTPIRLATASKRRPIDEVERRVKSPVNLLAEDAQCLSSPPFGGTADHQRQCQGHGHILQQCARGARTAASPPGRGKYSRWATRSKPAKETIIASPPQVLPSVPYPVPSNERPINFLSSKPLSTMHETMCA